MKNSETKNEKDMKTNLFYFSNFIIIFISACSSIVPPEHTSSPVQIESIGQLGYQKITLDNKLTYYYLPSDRLTDPLVIGIQGSGCDSHFSKKNGVVYGNLPPMIGRPLKGKAAILIVEKSGVAPFEQNMKADVTGCPEEFRKNFNIDSWTDTLKRAATDLQKRYQLKPSKLIIIGHSEGAGSAANLASKIPEATHVISMSGGSGTAVFQAVLRAMKAAEGNSNDEDKYIRQQIKT